MRATAYVIEALDEAKVDLAEVPVPYALRLAAGVAMEHVEEEATPVSDAELRPTCLADMT